MKTIQIMRVKYPDIQIAQWQGRQVRGFFAGLDWDDPMLHHHLRNGATAYGYPLVQYKVLNGHPAVVAANEGINHIYPLVMQNNTLSLNHRTYPCGRRKIELGEEQIGACNEYLTYRFLSPWFGLNQANFEHYTELEEEEREELLSKILIGNILSLSKSFGVTVENRLQVSANLIPRRTQFKGEVILSFTGTFSVNYRLPDLLGIGKSVSRGYGTIGEATQRRE